MSIELPYTNQLTGKPALAMTKLNAEFVAENYSSLSLSVSRRLIFDVVLTSAGILT
ncbi:MAG: hypothetical protein AAGF83_27715 [Cyanobacteria bacterium P01_G01_bin.67]